MKNIKNITDEALMKRLQKNGDEAAFNEIYLRYSQRLLYFMFKMLGQDEAKAQDFLQDVFLKIIAEPDKFNTAKNFKTWIFTVAANKCKNDYRVIKPSHVDLHPEIVSETENADKLIDQELFKTNLSQYLNELIPVYKEVFVLRYHEGLSLNEIAIIVACPLGTVKSRLFSATKILSEKLDHFKQNYYAI
ncbi:RNA polymerase sigma factor [Crocinitomix catalasitica]|uniref:RNA polymerase sigma factor n=1 Tax=Crocinitomix catalasitica TaxID=184607 RepID=UPI00048121C5|nr:RNA polymerase sigma factor [Crocinitomix catalasitica]